VSGAVLECGALRRGTLEALFGRFGLSVCWCAEAAPIPGSYWGEPEAGLIGDTLYVRTDTPVHSALHEGGHFVCMDAARRAALHTDAGGTLLEECAVCYLEILLADELPGVGRARIQQDMDAWGYTFRLGSAAAWFEADAEDAAAFLRARGLVDDAGRLVVPEEAGESA
jgi:hypothetical protein